MIVYFINICLKLANYAIYDLISHWSSEILISFLMSENIYLIPQLRTLFTKTTYCFHFAKGGDFLSGHA